MDNAWIIHRYLSKAVAPLGASGKPMPWILEFLEGPPGSVREPKGARRSERYRARFGVTQKAKQQILGEGGAAFKWLHLILGGRTRAPDPPIYVGGLRPPTPPLNVALRPPYLSVF